LEDNLLEFPGALVLVTHDRWLLDRVSTMLLALDGQGNAEWFADYPQWEAAQRRKASSTSSPRSRQESPPTSNSRSTPKRKGLSYQDQREWDKIEGNIEKAEAALAACRAAVNDPAIVSDAEALQARHTALETAQAAVEQLYTRWAELEDKRTSL
jgi:ATP-binding cassette subfamily F protein uup